MQVRNMKPLLCLALILASPLLRAEEDVVGRAMHDEMQRSMQKLRLEQLDKPYFISYLVVDNESKEVAATLGSLLSSTEGNTRSLMVVVRVGDYEADSGNFLSMLSGPEGLAATMMTGMIQLPLDDNYNELRRKIWLTTDRAYKKALEDLSGSVRCCKTKIGPRRSLILARRCRFQSPTFLRSSILILRVRRAWCAKRPPCFARHPPFRPLACNWSCSTTRSAT